jgi:hypothetical protein
MKIRRTNTPAEVASLKREFGTSARVRKGFDAVKERLRKELEKEVAQKRRRNTRRMMARPGGASQKEKAQFDESGTDFYRNHGDPRSNLETQIRCKPVKANHWMESHLIEVIQMKLMRVISTT